MLTLNATEILNINETLDQVLFESYEDYQQHATQEKDLDCTFIMTMRSKSILNKGVNIGLGIKVDFDLWLFMEGLNLFTKPDFTKVEEFYNLFEYSDHKNNLALLDPTVEELKDYNYKAVGDKIVFTFKKKTLIIKL